MEFVKLNKWIAQYEEYVKTSLLHTKELLDYYKKEIRAQVNIPVTNKETEWSKENGYIVVEGFPSYSYGTVAKKWEVVTETYNKYNWKTNTTKAVEQKLLISYVNLKGKEYALLSAGALGFKDEKQKYCTLLNFLKDNGHTATEIKLVEGKDSEWIANFAKKDAESTKKYILAKVRKICGNDVTEVQDSNNVDDLIVIGSNGRRAHIYAIAAGGYNIQRLHMRILVKELKR